MTSFRTLITSHPGLTEELPLIHTSRCELLSSIATTHALEPQPCGVFHESLVYLFYGRPAYRSNRGSMGGEPIALCPVCFVFKPRTVSQVVHRMYPCDTGAVAADRFTPEIRASDLAQLALAPQIDSARRLVSLMFERNSDYFVGKVVQAIACTPGSVEARFYALLMRDGPVGYDDRKSAIEVQVNQAIALRDQLLFVVLPREFLEEVAIRDAIINVWNCDPVVYATFMGDAPASYYSVVRQKVQERFAEATRI
jgi:hypothetical protein